MDFRKLFLLHFCNFALVTWNSRDFVSLIEARFWVGGRKTDGARRVECTCEAHSTHPAPSEITAATHPQSDLRIAQTTSWII